MCGQRSGAGWAGGEALGAQSGKQLCLSQGALGPVLRLGPPFCTHPGSVLQQLGLSPTRALMDSHPELGSYWSWGPSRPLQSQEEGGGAEGP